MIDDARAGFTLVELLLVMALLAVVAAFSAPLLSNSLHSRNLNDEANRFLALTEYARNEASSQGVPMTVWIDPQSQRFGTEAQTGFEGDEDRAKDYTLNPDVHFEMDRSATRNGLVDVAAFTPDGAPSTTNIDAIRIIDRFGSALTLARTSDGWGYEIVK